MHEIVVMFLDGVSGVLRCFGFFLVCRAKGMDLYGFVVFHSSCLLGFGSWNPSSLQRPLFGGAPNFWNQTMEKQTQRSMSEVEFEN